MAPKAKRTNENIRANKVQVIAESGEQLGIMSLSEAISKASALEMDIVEIGMQGGVVLTKMMDYGKFLFKQQKSQNKSHCTEYQNIHNYRRIHQKFMDGHRGTRSYCPSGRSRCNF